jgi:SAM-dependent methyltransferase
MAPPRSSYTYLLGDSRAEAARLRAQARLWDPTAHALFDRLKIRRRVRILEIGPGAGSLHRERRRRVRGPVDAVEPSETFARGLERLAARDGFGKGRIWRGNLSGVDLPRASYDVIFARWVFLFLPDPAAHVRQLARALAPGGVLAVEDYQRETLRMIPPPAAWERFLAADRAFFESQGGDASIGARLAPLFARAGLEVVDITPTVRSGHPGSRHRPPGGARRLHRGRRAPAHPRLDRRVETASVAAHGAGADRCRGEKEAEWAEWAEQAE